MLQVQNISLKMKLEVLHHEYKRVQVDLKEREVIKLSMVERSNNIVNIKPKSTLPVDPNKLSLPQAPYP